MLAHEQLIPLAVVILVALTCGVIFTRLRQPAVIGYILAGVVLGPAGFGLVRNEENIALLADLGVLMLLFVIGMELSLRAFRRIWRIALATVALQTASALFVVWFIGQVMGWPTVAIVLLAFVLALSSTAVAVKILEDIGELRTRTGRIAVGILIAQDLAIVPMILLIDVALLGEFSIVAALRIVLSVGLLLALILFLSRRRRVNLPLPAIIAGHADLTPLLGLACCFGAATISGLLGLSPAYGAFLAGLTIGNSNLRVGMLDTVLPIQSILMMVFFLSIGLLIDLSLVWANLGVVVVMLLVATVGKTLVNLAIFAALRLPWAQALLTALVLSQVGEFSFLLGSIGFERQVISIEEFRIIITVTALSLVVSPLWMGAVRRLHRVATFQRVSVRYVFRIAFGREADRISGGVAMVVRLARNTGTLVYRRMRPDRARVEPHIEPQIEDTRVKRKAND
ncbi:MAG: cation:proton antiporter [Alphaproteobacteria bacterium]|nr:cation:proton antiporter [Alphaproteobacteria bacterium]